ncbi:hypothetical protein [Salinarchaeum laminariae]|uniref:hypothetical protein n=1 Tax=Salinarchaeum laminariae TaxID=869888 RepID=UPI0020BF4A29|nr:hypothetical protein [Salinarchaeum laminariae]
MIQLQHRLRHAVGGVADSILPGRCYGVFTLKPSEFVGSLDVSLAEVRSILEARSYSYNPISAKKLHPELRIPDDGSYRRLDPQDRSKQWHVHLWERPDCIEVYSHYEYRPEPWGPIDVRRPVDHYWPEWGESCLLGQHCPALKSLLETYGRYEGDRSALGTAPLYRHGGTDEPTPAADETPSLD